MESHHGVQFRENAEFLQRNGVSVEEIADRLGMSVATMREYFSRWERGVTR